MHAILFKSPTFPLKTPPFDSTLETIAVTLEEVDANKVAAVVASFVVVETAEMPIVELPNGTVVVRVCG